jgi:N-hydroxyarylamine O-acetyltransferase
MTDTAPPPIDLPAYLARIGIEGGLPPPTLETLARLQQAHAHAIAFENVEVLARRVPDLALAALEDKIVRRGRGGYCFEQNGLFLGVLRALGFRVRALEGRVRTGVPADVETGRTHMALAVTLDGEEWLADVGFGGLAPTAPLRLASRAEQATPHGAYRLVEAEADLLLQARTFDGWIDGYRLGPDRPRPIDAEMGNWFVATSPGAFLRRNLLVSRSTAAGRLTLFNRELTLRQGDDAPTKRLLASHDEIARTLRIDMGLRIDDADLAAVLAILDTAAG